MSKTVKKLTSLLVAFVMLLGVFSALPIAASAYAIPSEEGFEQKLQQLRKSYPHGGTYAGVYYEGGSAKAWTCYGYACQIGFSVFGSSQYTLNGGWTRSYSMDTLNAGDIVRIRYDSHSVFITKVTDTFIYYTDANFDGYNGIEWDQKWTYAELRAIFSYKWHIAGNNLVGGGHVHNFKTYDHSGQEHPHYRYFKCSCGQVKVDKTKYTYVADCEDCNHPVSYDAGQGENAPAVQNKKFLSPLTLSAAIPTLSGNSFMGWSEDDNDSIEFLPKDSYTEDRALALYAVWSDVLPMAIQLDESLTLSVGESKSLTPKTEPEYVYPTYTWKSDDTNIAKVNSAGKITGVSLGKTTVTATSSNGRVAACEVTVNLPAPEITKSESVLAGVKLSWGAVDGAAAYRVFMKVGDSWKKMADTADTSFLHQTTLSNKNYVYTVRCLDENGGYISAYQSYSHLFIATPAFLKVENVPTGVKLSWNKVAGASGYRLQLQSGDTWKNLTDTASTSFTHTTDVSGRTDVYAIRCIDNNGKFISGANRYTNTFIATPGISGFSNTATGVKISWKAIKGAQKYRVYKKVGESWSVLGTTTANSILHKTDLSGKKYVYTIRCISGDETSFVSGYVKAGFSNKFVAQPAPKSVKNTATGVRFVFSRVSGAAKYRVFRKTGAGAWVKLGDVAASRDYILDKTAKTGKTYTYTVRCLSSDGKKYESSYDTTGLTIKYKK